MPADIGQVWASIFEGNDAHNVNVAILVQVICLAALCVGICVTRI